MVCAFAMRRVDERSCLLVNMAKILCRFAMIYAAKVKDGKGRFSQTSHEIYPTLFGPANQNQNAESTNRTMTPTRLDISRSFELRLQLQLSRPRHLARSYR